ncbi:uncharacterized protein LOC126662074 [Mercurialis annua]|uniref:uncharacterized protein LOC126662074 n=1 Tax=Mercurialis annua TaxID=3986 RepID=UPI002160242A|nr:uncharacterized protein LOC126662074 [Mercurialis annua]
MDKSWMIQPRHSDEYRRGVKNFLDFAFHNASEDGRIMCPCRNCVSRYLRTYDEAEIHLVCDGFMKGYTRWVFHGEAYFTSSTSSAGMHTSTDIMESVQDCTMAKSNPWMLDDVTGLLHDAFNVVRKTNEVPLDTDRISNPGENEVEIENGSIEMESEGMHHEASSKENVDFVKLLKAADEELYPGCKTFSSLSFFLHLYHLKCLHRWTEKSFTMLLELLLDAFPGGVSLPKSFYQAKKIIQALGLDYKKIHACPNHCMLYWGETENQELCRICGSSRWAVSRGSNQNDCHGKFSSIDWFCISAC